MNSTTPRRLFLVARLCGIPLFAATFSATAAGQCYYTHQLITPPPGGRYLVPVSINNLGHVTGYLDFEGIERAFVWTPGSGGEVLPRPAGVNRMQATSINDLGHICGWMDWDGGLVTAFLSAR